MRRFLKLRRFNKSGKGSVWLKKADGFMDRHFSGNTMDHKQIFAIFLPLLLDQAFLVCMSFLNTAMISSYGATAVSAVNTVDSINNFLVSAIIAVATGGTVVIAQYKGRGDFRQMSKSISATVFSVFFLSAGITAILLLFFRPILRALCGDTNADLMGNAQIYMVGAGISYCGIAVKEAIGGALRGIGETRTSLLLSVVMNGFYVILNIIFIIGLQMGVTGMSISLNLSRYLAAALGLFLLIKRKDAIFSGLREFLNVEFSLIKRVLVFGVPFAAEQLFFNGGKILSQRYIVGLGLDAMVINAICGSLNALGTIPQNALMLTMVTVVGQSLGNKDVIQAKKTVKSMLISISLSSVLTFVLIWLLFRPMITLFRPNPLIVPDIFLIILSAQIGQIFLWGTSFALPAVLRTGGDARFTSVMSMLTMWLFRVVMGYVLGIILGMGVFGVWVAMIAEWGIRSVVFGLRYSGNKWYRHKVIE